MSLFVSNTVVVFRIAAGSISAYNCVASFLVH